MDTFPLRWLLVGIGVGSHTAAILAVCFLAIWMKKNGKKNRATATPTLACQEPICKELVPLVVKLVKSELALEEGSIVKGNEGEVINHLRNMMRIHRQKCVTKRSCRDCGEAEPSERGRKCQHLKRSMYQCLRTTLVRHPNDIRGRRRAKRTMDILKNCIFEDTNCIYRLSTRLSQVYLSLNRCIKLLL